MLRAEDMISGREGRAYAVINGNVEELFYAKSIEATVEKNKAEVKTLGNRATQHKATGWSGKGTLTIYYVTSLFRRLMLDYTRTGKDLYFSLQIVNDDPASIAGRQTVVLHDVNLDSVIAAKLDTESDGLEEEVPFTFSGWDIPDQFQAVLR